MNRSIRIVVLRYPEIPQRSNLCTVYRKHAECVSIIGLVLFLMVIRDDCVRRGLLPHPKILAIYWDTVPVVGSCGRIWLSIFLSLSLTERALHRALLPDPPEPTKTQPSQSGHAADRNAKDRTRHAVTSDPFQQIVKTRPSGGSLLCSRFSRQHLFVGCVGR